MALNENGKDSTIKTRGQCVSARKTNGSKIVTYLFARVKG